MFRWIANRIVLARSASHLIAYAAYMEQGDEQKSQEYAERIFSLNPNSAYSFLIRAIQQASHQNYEQVLMESELIRVSDLSVASRVLRHEIRGLALWNLKRWDEAVLEYMAGLRIDSNPDRYFTLIAGCFYYSKDYQNAIEYYTYALRNPSNNLKDLYQYRAHCHYKLKRWSEALKDYQKVVALGGQSVFVFKRICLIYIELKDYGNTIINCNVALGEMKEDEKYWVWFHEVRGMCYVELENYEMAFRNLEIALHANPLSSFARIWRGVAHIRVGQLDQALDEFNQMIESTEEEKNKQYAYTNRAYIYGLKNRYDEALESIHDGLMKYPNDSILYHMRGFIRSLQGDLDQAFIDFAKAKELSARDVDWHAAVSAEAVIFWLQGQKETAKQLYVQVVKYDPKQGSIEWMEKQQSVHPVYSKAIKEIIRETNN